jgi:hypothetical protein
MCRWAVITWPLSGDPEKNHIVIGEFYDPKYKTSTVVNSLRRDLTFWYPLKMIDGIFDNEEEVDAMRNKYHLTRPLYEKISCKLVSPVLYDLSCMTPLFVEDKKLPGYTEKSSEKIGIIFPNLDPSIRGCIIKQMVLMNLKKFITLGGPEKKNLRSTAALSRRFLLMCKVPPEKICKIRESRGCLENALRMCNTVEVVIGCSVLDISWIGPFVRCCREIGIFRGQVRFVVNNRM